MVTPRIIHVGMMVLVWVVMSTIAAGCSTGDDGGSAATNETIQVEEEYKLTQQFALSISMSSTKFNETRRIPRKYSCTKEDVSPPIMWGEVPEGTVSLALLVESNQIPGPLWVHWLLWGIPGDANALQEAVPNTAELPSIGPKTGQGTNSTAKTGWSGPCPSPLMLDANAQKGRCYQCEPKDTVKQYFFRLFALDSVISPSTDATKEDFLRAIDGHVLAGGELIGEHQASPGHITVP